MIKLVQSELVWAWLPNVLSESQYVTEHLEPIKLNELKQGLKFSYALCPHSKLILAVKKSLLKAIDEYVKHFFSIHLGHL